MAEVLSQFTSILLDNNGVRYRAQACGAPMEDGKWQGWIEFSPLEGGAPIRSGRETTQPNRIDTVYWASGLTPVYLEGALERALNPLVVRDAEPAAPEFKNPAPLTHIATGVPIREAVLNPYSVVEKGEGLLRNQLGALSAWHLVNIIEAYRLSDEPSAVLSRLSPGALIEIIAAAVAPANRSVAK